MNHESDYADDLNDAFYQLKPESRKQVVPASIARYSFYFSLICGVCVAIALLVLNLQVAREQISDKILDGWTCTQLSSKSRALSEIPRGAKCGYQPPNGKSSPMNWINYGAFQGSGPNSAQYTELPECFTNSVPTSRQNSLPIWTFRDSYSWSDQTYSSYEECTASLTPMCMQHRVVPLEVPSLADTNVPWRPYFESSKLYSNAFDSKTGRANPNPNPKWMLFNGSSCRSPCGTGASVKISTSKTFWSEKSVQLPNSIQIVADQGQVLAMTSDLSQAFFWSRTYYQTAPALSDDGGNTFRVMGNNPCGSAVSSKSEMYISGDGKVQFSKCGHISNDGGVNWSPTPSAWSDFASIAFDEKGFYFIAISVTAQQHIVGSRPSISVPFSTSIFSLGQIYVKPTNPSPPIEAIPTPEVFISADGKMQVIKSFYVSSTIVFSSDYGASWNLLNSAPWCPQSASAVFALTLSGDGQTILIADGTDLLAIKNWFNGKTAVIRRSAQAVVFQRSDCNGFSASASFSGSLIAVSCSTIQPSNPQSSTPATAILSQVRSLAVSFDSGNSWQNAQPRLSETTTIQQLSLKVSSDGKLLKLIVFDRSVSSSIRMIQTSTVSQLRLNSGSSINVQMDSSVFNIPTVSYDEDISSSSTSYSTQSKLISNQTNCRTSEMVSSVDRALGFCALTSSKSSESASEILQTNWDSAQFSDSKQIKRASQGKWTFGGFAFCLEDASYSSCESQFQSQMCTNGYFKEMMTDIVCSKYKSNPPYLCTAGPDVFSALSLSASTAGSVISGLLGLLVAILSRKYDSFSTKAPKSPEIEMQIEVSASSTPSDHESVAKNVSTSTA